MSHLIVCHTKEGGDRKNKKVNKGTLKKDKVMPFTCFKGKPKTDTFKHSIICQRTGRMLEIGSIHFSHFQFPVRFHCVL
jgi:hypothetical protein